MDRMRKNMRLSLSWKSNTQWQVHDAAVNVAVHFLHVWRVLGTPLEVEMLV